MSAPVTGIIDYSPSAASTKLVMIKNGWLWTWNGSTATRYTGGTVSTTALCHMTQANDVIYGADNINGIFKFDGSTYENVTVNDYTATALTTVSALLYHGGRMWYADKDQIHFSDINAPETIANAPLQVSKGDGSVVKRLLPFRDGNILAFKMGPSGGSIHLLLVGGADPDGFGQQLVFDGISLVAPHAIVRAGNDNNDDVFFLTREGMRSLRLTELNSMSQPGLPISDNVSTYIDDINWTHVDKSFAVYHDDEILLWLPLGADTTPQDTLVYDLSVPKAYPQQGWTIIDMMPGRCACVSGVGSTEPAIYYGDNDGNLKKAFQTVGSHTYTEISRGVTFASDKNPTAHNLDKYPFRFILDTETPDTSTTINVSLLAEDGEVVSIGSRTYTNQGITLPVTLPLTFGNPAITADFADIHFDSNNNPMRRFRDVRVKITSTGSPKILGWSLQAFMDDYRYIAVTDDARRSITAGRPAEDTVTAGALTER